MGTQKKIDNLAQKIDRAERLKSMAEDQLMKVNDIHSRLSASLKQAIDNLADANRIVEDSNRTIKEIEESMILAEVEREQALDCIQLANKVLGQWN